jgi:hypothetical protein
MPSETMFKTTQLPPLRKRGRATDLFLPDDISEQSGINAWILSTLNKTRPVKVTKSIAAGTRMVAFRKKESALPQSALTAKKAVSARGVAKKATSKSAGAQASGAPLIRENYIEITIADGNDTHGSLADHILLHFGDGHRIKLMGRSSTKFQRGDTLKWDFNTIQSFMENIHTDAWDELTLETEFKDGIKIARVVVVHSGETILDWNEQVWLDNSIMEANRYIPLTAQILQKKLGSIDQNWIAQIHWAAREIGKTDPTKYGTVNAWCSEFASWALRKAKWDTPEGNIGSQAMENYFAGIGRAHQVSEILNGSYVLNPGDYLRFQWPDGGQHSGIFIDYHGNPATLTTATRLKTIEGNTSSTVRVRTGRTLGDVISCGNTR